MPEWGPALAEGELPNGASVRVVLGSALDEEALDVVLELMLAAFGDDWPDADIVVPQRDHLAWKLAGANTEGASYLTLVEMDDQLVATAITGREQVMLHGREYTFEGGGDACTHPDYERRGMYSQRRAFETGNIEDWLAGSVTASANPTVIRERERRGAPVQAGMQPRIHTRIIDAGRFARRRREQGTRLPGLIDTLATRSLGVFGRALEATVGRQRSAGWDIVEVERFDERYDALFAEAAPQFEFAKVRSADYLNWRYADLRGGRYASIAAIEGEQLLGYLAYKLADDRGLVMDMLAQPGRTDVVGSLLREASRRFAAASVEAGVCWLPRRHPYRSTLRRQGYLDFAQTAGIQVEAYSELPSREIEFLEDPNANIHLTLGDLDGA